MHSSLILTTLSFFHLLSWGSSTFLDTNSLEHPWWDPPNTSVIISENEYPVEEHQITTEDGYILTVFRIPFGKKNRNVNRPPVLLQHGFLCSAVCWVIPMPEKGLGYILADAGYDVWLGNNRGTTYCRKHKKLSSKDPKFWEFSVHELGRYDVPAMIDYVLKVNGQSRLTYIGHSQGTTQFFIALSERPEYNKKVTVMSALAPVAFVDGIKGISLVLSLLQSKLDMIFDTLNFHHILIHDFAVSVLAHYICHPGSKLLFLCETAFNIVAGFDSPQLNKTLVETIAHHCPTGTSIKQLRHNFQMIKSGKFRQYDYGLMENLKVYGSPTPPDYNLNSVQVPTVLHHASNDYLSSVDNVKRLSKRLPRLVGKFLVPYEKFNHVDFMWAIDVNKLLYNTALDILKQFNFPDS